MSGLLFHTGNGNVGGLWDNLTSLFYPFWLHSRWIYRSYCIGRNESVSRSVMDNWIGPINALFRLAEQRSEAPAERGERPRSLFLLCNENNTANHFHHLPLCHRRWHCRDIGRLSFFLLPCINFFVHPFIETMSTHNLQQSLFTLNFMSMEMWNGRKKMICMWSAPEGKTWQPKLGCSSLILYLRVACSIVQGGWGGWPTGNVKKLQLRNSQKCCLAQLCLAAA